MLPAFGVAVALLLALLPVIVFGYALAIHCVLEKAGFKPRLRATWNIAYYFLQGFLLLGIWKCWR